MKQPDFSLIPAPASLAPDISITGNITRQNNRLYLNYYLTDSLARVVIPPPMPTPQRRYNLWEHTCFEFFLGLKNTDEYWEFNLSPSGNWNVFHFLSYRHNIAEEMNFSSLAFNVSQKLNNCSLELEVDLNKIINPEQNLDIGITAVVETNTAKTNVTKSQSEPLSFWALCHPGNQADFHDRASFLLIL